MNDDESDHVGVGVDAARGAEAGAEADAEGPK